MSINKYFEWRYPDPDALILLAYMPDGQTYPTGHYLAGRPCFYDGNTVSGADWAADTVKAIEAIPHKAIWATTHKADALAAEQYRWGKRWNKWDIGETSAFQFLELDFDNVLLIDCPPKVAASDAERQKICQHVQQVKADLIDRGLPTPLITSTGNGYLLSFPIDLPSTPTHLNLMRRLGACLALAFDRPFTNLDTGVLTDPSRILGVAGTWNRGKRAIPEDGRHHRIREIIGEYPDREPMTGAEFTGWAEQYIAEAVAIHGDTLRSSIERSTATPEKRAARPQTTEGISAAVKAARRYIAKVPPAIEGSEGDKHTFRTAGQMLAFGLTTDEVFMIMQEWNDTCSPPWTDDELRTKINSAATNGTPRAAKRVVTDADLVTWGGDNPIPFDVASPPHCLPHTDLGNARRLVHYHHNDIRFVPSIGWHVWAGSHWQMDATGQAMRFAKSTAERIHLEADHCRRKNRDTKDLFKWSVASESSARLESMLQVASTEAAIVASPDDLDRDPFLFNVQNGTIDLRSGQLRPHDRNDLLTRVSPISFDPDAACPTFDAFMSRIFVNRPLADYVMTVLGHCLTGDISLEHLWVCYGGGANGKSTLLAIIQHIMASYAGSAPESLLMVGREEHPTELADLQGRRLVIASETESNARLKIQLIKRLTGDPTIKARRMRQDFYEFGRTHKTLMMTNNKPRVRENSEAVWRRLKLIPFSVEIPQSERDAQLGQKLKAEASGILNRLISGCLDWQRSGLIEPSEVTEATAAYRDESDPLGDWIDDRCIEAVNAWCTTDRLYMSYADHCKRGGENAIDKRAFGLTLGKRGYHPQQKNAGRGWSGISIKVRDPEASWD
jgi:putative DNA primase/helicase